MARHAWAAMAATPSKTCTDASRALADGCHPPLWIASALGYSYSTVNPGGLARAGSPPFAPC